jgi:adenine-specific DNA-methyltransferase
MIKQRLELDWIGKDDKVILEPRILIEDGTLSDGDKSTENMLIQGDNLLALKALESDFQNRIKCIYIDPPYNTGSAFEKYEDGLEHSKWLSLMKNRLILLHRLLKDDGSIWISIDDNECHYLKVVMDEVFGRQNFLTTIIWQKIYTVKNSAKHFSTMHDYILVYAKNKEIWRRNDLPRSSKQDDAYKNQDNDPRGVWKATPLHARNKYSKGLYKVKCPSGRVLNGPPSGTYWRVSEENFVAMNEDNRIWWGEDGNNTPSQKRFLTEVQGGLVPSTIWFHNDVGTNSDSKNETRKIFEPLGESFLTPKPEKLIKQILEIATKPQDWVLDSFLGSGTTSAVAHKMKRKWIGIELGNHCQTLCLPRLKDVVEGKDNTAVTQALDWKGGGGFKFMTLAPSLLEKDDRGNWVISKKYNATMLASAVCKHEGFKFHPDQRVFWKQGYSTEKDFIYVTTQFLTAEQLERIFDKMKPDETLLICAKAFKVAAKKFDRITIKKIPQSLLNRGVEFGRDDYSLNIRMQSQEEMDMEIDAEN